MQPAALLPVLYLAVVTVPLVRVDLREHRLPNAYVLPGIGVGLVAAALQWTWVPLAAGAAYAGVLGVFALGGAVGMGDVKLAALLGLAAGAGTPAAAVVAFLLGGVVASVVLVRGGRGRRIAFGPWMLAGYWVAAGASIAGMLP